MRRFGKLQDRCQNMLGPGGRFLREKFSSSNENPHGFELPRTLSCKPEPVRIVCFLTSNRHAQRSNVAATVETTDRDRVLAG